MEYIDLHAHMVSRTTDDYRAMAMSGCVAVTEPAFWAGYDRPGVDAFIDYFNTTMAKPINWLYSPRPLMDSPTTG